jgi:hypothetical protein
MCMHVIDDGAVMSRIVREVYGDLPEINEVPGLLGEIAIICPLTKLVDRLYKYCVQQIP